jgi:glycosyltransferase involved in cell wall biosynthesis
VATLLHLTTVHPRSDTRILIKEAQSLASNLPHKVFLMVADGKGNVDEEHGRVSIHDLGRLVGGRLRRALIGPWRAFFAIRKIKPDIVHFHDPELIPLGMLLRVIGYKVIYDVHEDVPRQILSKHWLPWIMRRPIAWVTSAVEWLSAKAFDAIVPATPKIAGRFPAAKTVMIQNFPIANELLLTDPIPYIERPQSFVYPGVIAEIRGAVEMVRALELLGDIPGARLDLAGTFSPLDLADALRTLPGWNAVNYHGEVTRKQLAHLLGGARAGLVLHHPVPNEIDAQPIKMFEYMATGLPIIASDFRPLRKIIDEEKCGLIVDQSDPKAIAEAMLWILDHPTEAEAMGRNGRLAVERTYNWDAEAAKIIGLHNNLLTPRLGLFTRTIR